MRSTRASLFTHGDEQFGMLFRHSAVVGNCGHPPEDLVDIGLPRVASPSRAKPGTDEQFSDGHSRDGNIVVIIDGIIQRDITALGINEERSVEEKKTHVSGVARTLFDLNQPANSREFLRPRLIRSMAAQ